MTDLLVRPVVEIDRASTEYVPFTVLLSPVTVTADDCRLAIVSDRPDEDDLFPAVSLETGPPLVLGLLTGPDGTIEREPGTYKGWIKIDAPPEGPLIHAIWVEVT